MVLGLLHLRFVAFERVRISQLQNGIIEECHTEPIHCSQGKLRERSLAMAQRCFAATQHDRVLPLTSSPN
jgi:hypothetical protein